MILIPVRLLYHYFLRLTIHLLVIATLVVEVTKARAAFFFSLVDNPEPPFLVFYYHQSRVVFQYFSRVLK